MVLIRPSLSSIRAAQLKNKTEKSEPKRTEKMQKKLGLLGAVSGCLGLPGLVFTCLGCLSCLGLSGLLWVAWGCLELLELSGGLGPPSIALQENWGCLGLPGVPGVPAWLPGLAWAARAVWGFLVALGCLGLLARQPWAGGCLGLLPGPALIAAWVVAGCCLGFLLAGCLELLGVSAALAA